MLRCLPPGGREMACLLSKPQPRPRYEFLAALYVNDRVLPIPAESLAASSPFPFSPILLDEAVVLREGEFHVYLAGPFFNIAQR